MKGLVLKSVGSNYRVKTENGIAEYRLGGRFRLDELKHTNPVSVGDYVIISEEGLIIDVAERKNYLIRKATRADKQTHIVAANMDQVLVMASLKQPRTSTGFIDRILITAEAYAIPAILVFNKKDLLKEHETEEVDYLRACYEEIGYPTFLISTLDEASMAELKKAVTGKITLVTGHSGVGKSSWVNHLDPNLHLRTDKISRKYEKGKHTTTFAEMYPLEDGGYLIDTPGIKEFGLHEMDAHQLGDYFPEFLRLKPACKFNNCTHRHEPGCAVLEALEAGEIAPHRYQNYVNMIESMV